MKEKQSFLPLISAATLLHQGSSFRNDDGVIYQIGKDEMTLVQLSAK